MKAEKHCTCLTVSGNQLDFQGKASTPTAKLTTAKCLINSMIATPQARFMVVDIKDVYLNTPMDWYEYLRLPLAIIPNEIKLEYKLDGWVYVEI
jgi:hypothetical protein